MNKDSKNIIASAFEKVHRFFATSLGKGTLGIVTAVVGFVLNALMQDKNKESVCQILDEIRVANESVNVDQIEKVIGAFFSPWSLNNIIYAVLWFFVGIVLADLISATDTHKEISGEDWSSENIIVDLLNHLTEQVYNRCSNSSEHCGQCSKFASEDDSLIRRYLYEESQHLQKAIAKSKEGEYSLDNNIPKFHTFAITHMLNTFGEQYSVIQWIGSNPYTDQNKYDETFDALDFDFLYTLLKKVTEPYAKNGDPYYKAKLTGRNKFKIKWLLIGDLECMKNNFDYIFYVIKQLSSDNNITINEQMDIISDFFEFYIIDEEKYQREIDDKLRNYSSVSYRRFFYLDNKPSFGIFGDQFMFVDSQDRVSHGSIYTRKYILDGSDKSLLDTSIIIYDKILKKSTKLDISNLWVEYGKIIAEDPEWENQLKSIWKQKIGGF